MVVQAISRIDASKVRVRFDDLGTDGTFANDGTIISGTMGAITRDELAYRIWRQQQDIKLKEPALRKMWKERK